MWVSNVVSSVNSWRFREGYHVLNTDSLGPQICVALLQTSARSSPGWLLIGKFGKELRRWRMLRWYRRAWDIPETCRDQKKSTEFRNANSIFCRKFGSDWRRHVPGVSLLEAMIFFGGKLMLMVEPCKNKHALLILAPRKSCAILPKVHMFLGPGWWQMSGKNSLRLLAMNTSKLGALCLRGACSKSACVLVLLRYKALCYLENFGTRATTKFWDQQVYCYASFWYYNLCDVPKKIVRRDARSSSTATSCVSCSLPDLNRDPPLPVKP